jgi:DNA repair photolyase
VRWDNLEKGASTQGLLPGIGESVVRTFDAPEALGVRFHEVEARSGLNHVPKQSRMPFRWTINPYRGCTHACTYCVHGDTEVLMATGRSTPLREVQVGDEIYGTEARGRYRRYVRTRVLAHWTTTKQAFRIRLEDGTTLFASGDHRFLSDRGWKYVTGREQGRARRPHLTLSNKLMGFGDLGAPPVESDEYRRGYLCGLIRGDGTIGHYEYARNGRPSRIHTFRLALTDFEALRRAQLYLAAMDVNLEERAFVQASAAAGSRPMRMIRTGAGGAVEQIEALIRCRDRPNDEWTKGFLAGIFDAEGSNAGCVRIANCESEIVQRVSEGLAQLGFDAVVEDRGLANQLRYVRLRGGLRERMRFFRSVDPAITRKRDLEGLALKSDAKLGVTEITPVEGEDQLFDITTGTGDFIANGIVSHNCFARPTHTYLDLNAREDFEREIVVKVNVPELVRVELARPSWKGEHVALGTNTDPYQWVEGRYRLMEGIWEAMRDYANPCSVLTKSPLLLRDVELMKQICERTEFVANLSIPTLEEKAWRQTEPHTPHPRKRIEAIAELARAGIPVGVLIAPIIPGVNDAPGQIEKLVQLCGDAGAESIGGVGLHLRGEVREIWFDWLRQYRPDLVPRYEELYRRGAYMPPDEREKLAARARGKDRPRRFRVRRGTEREGDGSAEPPRIRQQKLFR